MALRITAILGLDGSAFAQGINRADAMASRFAAGAVRSIGMRLAGIFAVGSMVNFSRKIMEMSDNLVNLARRLGVGVEWLQEMQFAAKHAGADLEHLTQFMERLGTVRFGISAGKTTATQAAALAQFGMTPGQFTGMSNEEIVGQIGRVMKGKNAQDFEGALRALGGRGADALAGMFVKGLDDAREEARVRGQVIASDVVKGLKAFHEELEILAKIITVRAAPALLQLIEVATKAAFRSKGATENVLTAFFEGRGNYNSGIEMGRRKGEFLSTLLGISNPVSAALLWLSGGSPVAGFDVGKAKAAYGQSKLETTEEEKKFWEDLRAMIAAMGAGAPGTGFKPLAPVSTSTFKPLSSDQLIQVGNFLGTNRSVLESLANRQVYLLAQIETHTKKMAEQPTPEADPDFV